jgi:hypothetical protein
MYIEYLSELNNVDWMGVAEASRVAVYAVKQGIITLEQAAKIVASYFPNADLQGWAEEAFKKSPFPLSQEEIARGAGALDYMDDAEAVASLANALYQESWWREFDEEAYPTEQWLDWVAEEDIPYWVKAVFFNVIDCIAEEEDEKRHSDKE